MAALGIASKRKWKISVDANEDVPCVDVEDVNESESENDDEKEETTCETSGGETSGCEGEVGNPSWADAMQKVLRGSGPVNKLLTKAKKDSDIVYTEVKKKDDGGFEIVENIDGVETVIKVKEEEVEAKPDGKYVLKQKQLKKKKLKEWEILLKKKPDISDRERERALSRIATKGVVQLFNAVKQQQVTVNTDVNKAKTERKKAKVMKNISKGDFLDLLHGRSKSINVRDEMKSKKIKDDKDEKDPTWELFRDDFMLGAKMKDWDKPNEDSIDI